MELLHSIKLYVRKSIKPWRRICLVIQAKTDTLIQIIHWGICCWQQKVKLDFDKSIDVNDSKCHDQTYRTGDKMSVTLILFSLMNLGFFRKKVAGKGPWEHASRMVCAMSMHISKKLFLKRRWWLMLLRRAAMLLDAEEHWRLPDEDYRVLYPSWKIKDDKEKKIELVTFLSPSLLQAR